MEIANQDAWDKGVAANQDPYGAAVYTFAQRWAEMMEAGLKEGKSIADIAKDTSHKADEEGITGFMYGAAVAVLSSIWKHGEELRKWHNLDIQLGTEGEKANETGGVLNPAIMNIG